MDVSSGSEKDMVNPPQSINSNRSLNPILFPMGLNGHAHSQTFRGDDKDDLLPESFEPGDKVRSRISTSVNLFESKIVPFAASPSLTHTRRPHFVEKDVICGRQRENFHHEGNKYFRELIQKNIGPYIGSRTKLEKGDSIIRITKIVNDNSPTGGFVKRDEQTGRWYRIKEIEARDKVGHAIRKAVQRLEDTMPAKADRLRREFATYSARAVFELAESSKQEVKLSTKKCKSKSDAKKSAGSKEKKETGIAPEKYGFSEPEKPSLSSLPGYSDRNDPALSSSHQKFGDGKAVASIASSAASYSTSSIPTITQRVTSANAAHAVAPLGIATSPQQYLSQGLSGMATRSLMPSTYHHFLALRLQERRSQDELALIRALQQQQEEKIRREIEYCSGRLFPVANTGDPAINMLPWRQATMGNPLFLAQHLQLQQYQSRLTPPVATDTFSDRSSQISRLTSEFLKKERKDEEGTH
ncbi:hypothetical protein IV203_007415 [Nitzschia inconspicua]|uniref:DUF6824 domain-containing protein n=1 Tax=Nitzschia inconspicua TaxID=303405 RepID=A0A9K3KF31_9STRA|nr:hypothetical protein IV203_007415 [Nitzschia inconspicua]